MKTKKEMEQELYDYCNEESFDFWCNEFGVMGEIQIILRNKLKKMNKEQLLEKIKLMEIENER